MREVDGEIFAKNCECTERAILMNKFKFANIPDEFKEIKVVDFKTTLYSTDAAKRLAKAAREISKSYIISFEKYQEEGKGLYFYSNTKGSGKTMLAIAIGNALMNMRGIGVKFVTTVDLLAEIKASYNDNSIKESDLINTLKKVKVLILDDIGTERLTGWSNEIFYQLINDRYMNKLVTIFTSNTHIKQLKHDERLIDRINKMSASIQMPEESIRTQMAERENADMIKELLGVK